MSWECSFRGDLHFLSNFYPSPFILNNVHYQTVEHYFQAMKTTDLTMRDKILDAPSPAKAKMIGRRAKLREGWQSMRDSIMFDGVYAKFAQNVELLDMLLNTPDHLLVEKNNWGDKYWGVDINTGYGLNKLGEILKEVKRLLGNCFEEPKTSKQPIIKQIETLLKDTKTISRDMVVKMYKLEDGRILIIEQLD